MKLSSLKEMNQNGTSVINKLHTFFEAGFVAVLEAGLAFEAGPFETAVTVTFGLGLGLEAAFFGLDSPVTA